MRVLFVCTGNYYRSRFAEAVLNHHLAAEGRTPCAFSRGLETWRVIGEGDLSPFTLRALAARGIDRRHTQPSPVQLTEADLCAATTTVVLDEQEHRPMMRAQFPAWEPRVTYWQVADVDRRAADDALSEIERRVRALFDPPLSA